MRDVVIYFFAILKLLQMFTHKKLKGQFCGFMQESHLQLYYN